MFIQTEATPNPLVIKFIPGKLVLKEGTRDFPTEETASASPLAMNLFSIKGVAAIFLGSDFVSVTKDEQSDWQHLKPAILGMIMEHYLSNAPIIIEDEDEQGASGSEGDDYDARDQSTVEAIKDLLETRVRPAVASDGGDITFHGYRDGIVMLRMQGACAGCPSSTITLKSGIENLLRHFIPEVVEVRAV